MTSAVDKENQFLAVAFDEEIPVSYTYEELATFALAYAMTVHKAQGSEYRLYWFFQILSVGCCREILSIQLLPEQKAH